jgi:hypothetical protein
MSFFSEFFGKKATVAPKAPNRLLEQFTEAMSFNPTFVKTEGRPR